MASNDAEERYRRAAEDALQQLDWCIGYLHGIRKVKISATEWSSSPSSVKLRPSSSTNLRSLFCGSGETPSTTAFAPS